MLIFRIHQDLNNGYDTYDSAVVVACDEEHARSIHPMGQQIVWDPELEAWVDEDGSNADWSASSWAAPRLPRARLKTRNVQQIETRGIIVSSPQRRFK